jgi:hypothetical protein
MQDYFALHVFSSLCKDSAFYPLHQTSAQKNKKLLSNGALVHWCISASFGF